MVVSRSSASQEYHRDATDRGIDHSGFSRSLYWTVTCCIKFLCRGNLQSLNSPMLAHHIREGNCKLATTATLKHHIFSLIVRTITCFIIKVDWYIIMWVFHMNFKWTNAFSCLLSAFENKELMERHLNLLGNYLADQWKVVAYSLNVQVDFIRACEYDFPRCCQGAACQMLVRWYGAITATHRSWTIGQLCTVLEKCSLQGICDEWLRHLANGMLL